MVVKQNQRESQAKWVLVWTLLGAVLRFLNLGSKPPWTDEFSTMVFSLGRTFRTVPLDQAISLETLLSPLRPLPSLDFGAVVQHLMSESTHPPLYFWLAHWWMSLFPVVDGLASVWGARSLSALLGVLAIPAMYGLGRWVWRSPLAGHGAALGMALSPFGIFLAQEARHYTLAILLVIASLACLVQGARSLQERRPLAWPVVALWIGLNALSVAVHYFCVLTLAAEGLVLGGWWVWLRWRSPADLAAKFRVGWGRLAIVALGSLASVLAWLPVWQRVYGSEVTQWIYAEPGQVFRLAPVFQALAAWITMVGLLPVEADPVPVVIGSGLLMLLFFVRLTPVWVRFWWQRVTQDETLLESRILTGFVLGAIALIFAITYGLGTDLTRGARYNFVYFPGLLALLGAALAQIWSAGDAVVSAPQRPRWFWPALTGKQVGILMLVMGVASALTVSCNLGYQKYYRPGLFLDRVQAQMANGPVLIATTHKTHVQTGEMMGIALELVRRDRPWQPEFLLAHQDDDPKASTRALEAAIARQTGPLDLWLVNFYAPDDPASQRCLADPQGRQAVDGYAYQHYRCPPAEIAS